MHIHNWIHSLSPRAYSSSSLVRFLKAISDSFHSPSLSHPCPWNLVSKPKFYWFVPLNCLWDICLFSPFQSLRPNSNSHKYLDSYSNLPPGFQASSHQFKLSIMQMWLWTFPGSNSFKGPLFPLDNPDSLAWCTEPLTPYPNPYPLVTSGISHSWAYTCAVLSAQSSFFTHLSDWWTLTRLSVPNITVTFPHRPPLALELTAALSLLSYLRSKL